MTEPALLLALAGGAALALLYLVALWRGVRALFSRGRPTPWMLGAALGRVLFVCAGLWMLSGGEGLLLCAALLGFFCTRTVALALPRRAPHGSRGAPLAPGRTT